MKSTLLVLIGLLSLTGLFLFNQQTPPISLQGPQTPVFQAYQAWKSEFGFNYNGAEESFRFEQFRANYDFIEAHNASKDQLVLKLNQFGAMNVQEFAQKALVSKQEMIDQSTVVLSSNNNNNSSNENINVDWTKKGAVMPTTDQGHCGSCWAFSSIGGLQGLRYLVTGKLERLSAQQLVSCIPKTALDPGGKTGCDGSQTMFAYTYTHENGIETWENYPYVSGEEGFVPACYHQKEDSVFFNKGENDGYVRIDRGDVATMKKQIQVQPMSVSVAAGNVYFQFYKEGTILDNEKCGNALDHAILMTAIYDVQGERPYWVVQNSWGDRWGTNGYGKIAIAEGDGICGINMKVVYPTSVDQKQE